MEVIERLRSAPVPEKVDETPEHKTPEAKMAYWLGTYRKQLAEHAEAKLKDYNRYVERAKGHLEKKELREALIEAARALESADDEKALLSSDWVQELTTLAVAKATEYREAKRWNKAHALYYDLTALFEDNKKYDKARLECLNIARLDVIYEDKDRWTELLEGIDPQNVIDALTRIERFYVQECDFRDVAAAGIERLMLLGESEKMREAFDGLADEELREEFTERTRARLKQVRRSKADRFHAKQAREHFARLLAVNDQTIRLPAELIVYEFMSGALDPLDDFTSVIWPVEFREFDKHTRGGFVGVGISITGGDEIPVRVVSPLEDTPAYRAGVLPDDIITHVDGKPIKDESKDPPQRWSLNKVVSTITGPMGTEVTLTIHRPALDKDIEFVLERAQVEIQSVKGYTRRKDDPAKWDFMIDPDTGIGYTRVTSFQENTVEQLSVAIAEMKAREAKGLILDLRFNPGGLMKAAIEMSQLFLDKTDTVVSTRGMREGNWQNPAADHDGPCRDLPLVVLVNEYSASASEIVSGALFDHERALIVGERTFGKFSVQKLMQLGGSVAHLKLTTARYYLPSGREMHHEEGRTEWGVMPNFEQHVVPKELFKIRKMWRDRDIVGHAPERIAAADDESSEDPVKETKTDDEETTTVAAGDDAAPDDKDEAVAGAEDAEEDVVGPDDDDYVLKLEPDPNELPDVDTQLETALLLMRLHVMGETELRVAAIERAEHDADAVRNP